MGKYEVGFVYVLSNEAMPGLVKVGYTNNLADDRAKELFTTAVPAPFVVEFRITVSRPKAVEDEAHRILSTSRYAGNREFFRVSPQTAIDAVRRSAQVINGIHAWVESQPHRIGRNDKLTLRLRAGQRFVLMRYSAILASSAEIVDIWQAHADGDFLEIFGAGDPRRVAGLSDGDPEGDRDPVPHLDRAGTARNAEIDGRERLAPGDRLLWVDGSDASDDCVAVLLEAQDHCQVVGRTYAPSLTPEGFPLLLNSPTEEELSEPVLKSIRAALALPLPRVWAPYFPSHRSESSELDAEPTSPEYWLPQLAAKKRPPRK